MNSEATLARAVCLLSGGMDSAVSLAQARADGLECYALTVAYGQRHACELEAAARVAQALGAREQRVVSVDLRALGGSALTDEIEVPKSRAESEIGRGVPSTYVPARNTIFLSIALGYAELVGARSIYLGINAIDYSGYPDCRPEFLAAFQALAQLATAAGAERGARLELRAPLVHMSKREIVLRGVELGVDFALTHSCYDPQRAGERWLACGHCDACQLRLAGFRDAGLVDPVEYADVRDRTSR